MCGGRKPKAGGHPNHALVRNPDHRCQRTPERLTRTDVDLGSSMPFAFALYAFNFIAFMPWLNL